MHCTNAVKSSLGAHFPSHFKQDKTLKKRKNKKEKQKKKEQDRK